MGNSYALDKKIEALNEIDRLDGNITIVAESTQIAYSTLKYWRENEPQLRRAYDQRRARERDRHYRDLQLDMLKRGKAVLELMKDDKLNKAPLNQLAAALGSLISHALKMSDVIEEMHDDQELVIRHEYFTDGELREAPPWADSREEALEKIHGSGLREALGQDHLGQNGHSGTRAGEATRLVAGADAADDEPGLARLESERETHQAHQDQRA